MSDLWTDEQHKRAKEICKNASPGPWRADVSQSDDVVVWSVNKELLANVGELETICGEVCVSDEPNAIFIAEARTLLPLAIDKIVELRDRLGRANVEIVRLRFGKGVTE